ncbi:MAG: hypothetical protein HY245_02290 [Rhizobiales bacterium]|nr:hypothetical protein [Hyphomicrobiales bacterium]MBI3672258.1 hypothetical protein [Hyphomicrobiales bacterium]
MPVCERDPWRLQYFEGIDCPEDVLIPTDDPDSWLWYPHHRWVYDKLRVAQSQGLACGPHGVTPDTFPVFSKPIMNLKGMGIGSRVIASAADVDRYYQPGHFWMELLRGRHVSTDCAVCDGRAVWTRHATGEAGNDGTFKLWTIHAEADAELEAYLAGWIESHMAGYTGMMNFETIGGRIIEAHLRFADQWCDLYGQGWVEALVRLYAKGVWDFDDSQRSEAYSLPLFARHGERFRHPTPASQAKLRAMPHVASLQITFHEDKDPAQHPMPPGGFRLGIVNATDLAAGLAARRELAKCFPAGSVILPD